MPHKTRILLLLKFFNSLNSWRSSTWELFSCSEKHPLWSYQWIGTISEEFELFISRNISTISELSSVFVKSKHEMFMRKISLVLFSLIDKQLNTVLSGWGYASISIFLHTLPPYLPNLPLWPERSWPWLEHNHQSVSTNGGSSLVPWSLPNYSRPTLPTNTLTMLGEEEWRNAFKNICSIFGG